MCLCVKCAERGDSLEGINIWYGSIENEGKMIPMNLQVFYISQ